MKYIFIILILLILNGVKSCLQLILTLYLIIHGGVFFSVCVCVGGGGGVKKTVKTKEKITTSQLLRKCSRSLQLKLIWEHQYWV